MNRQSKTGTFKSIRESIRIHLMNTNIDSIAHLTKSGLLNVVYKITYTIAMFATSVVLTRHMSLENYGIYSYAYAILMILVIPSHFGSPILIVREVSRSLESEDWSLIRGIIGWAGQFSGILSGVIVIGFWVLILLFPTLFDSKTVEVLMVGVFYIPFFAFSINIGGVLRGLHRIALGQLQEQILIPLFFLVLILANQYFGLVALEPTTAMGFHVISVVLTLLISWGLLSFVLPEQIRQSKTKTYGREWLRSMFSLAMITSMRLINKWVSIFILGIFVGPGEVGVFRIAVQMSILADIGIQIVTPVISPQLSRLYAKNEIDQIQNISILSTRITFLVNLVVSAGFLFWGKKFILHFYGLEYEGAFWALIILLIGLIFNSLVGPVANLLNMTGYENETAKARMVTTLINVGMNLVLCPRFGIIGAAFSSSVVSIIWNILLFRLVKRKINVNSFVFAKMIRKKAEG